MCWGLWSVRKWSNAVFPEPEQEKKKTRPTMGIHRGAAKEPSGSTLLDPMAPGILKKEKKEQKEQPGTWGEG